MKKIYNSHVLKFDGVHGETDHRQLIELLKRCEGSAVVVRVRQGDQKFEIDGLAADLLAAFQSAGVHWEQPFFAEVITRNPTALAPAKTDRTYVDTNDFKQAANPEGLAPHRASNLLRGCPMFFRENGACVDLVDMYRGMSVFAVLNGPSFQEIDHSLLRQPGLVTFGVNNGAHSFRPNLWACVDDPSRFMRSIWVDPSITKFVPMAHFRKPIWDAGANAFSKESVADFPNVIGFRRNEAFEAAEWLNEPTINWGNHADRGGGRSVLLAVLRIAYLLGFRKVYLVGCDFHMDASSKYWFAEDRTPAAIKNNQNSYRILTRYFEQLAPHFANAGFEVYNCTKGSKLAVFPFMALEDAIAAARVDVSASTEGMYVDRYKLQAEQGGAHEKKKPLVP